MEILFGALWAIVGIWFAVVVIPSIISDYKESKQLENEAYENEVMSWHGEHFGC